MAISSFKSSSEGGIVSRNLDGVVEYGRHDVHIEVICYSITLVFGDMRVGSACCSRVKKSMWALV